MKRHFSILMLSLSYLVAAVVSLETTHADADHLQKADQYFAEGNFGKALHLYERILNQQVHDIPYERLEQTYLALGLAKHAHALALRHRLTGIPDSWPGSWHCDMGMIAIQAGDIDELAVHVDALARIDASLQPHRDPRTVECLAYHEVFVRRFDAARRHLEWLAATEDIDHPPPNLAFLYLKQGREEHAHPILSIAERTATEAASESPDDPEPHFELAEFAAMRGDVPAAVAALANAMERGLGQTWWIYQLFDPESIPDPVFESLYGDPEFEKMRASVVKERTRMRPDHSD